MNKQLLKEHYIKHFGHGLVTGFALNYGIGISYAINDDDYCQVVSHNYEKRKSFRVTEVLEKKNDWCDYIRGGVKDLQKNGYNLKYGINAYIYI